MPVKFNKTVCNNLTAKSLKQ